MVGGAELPGQTKEPPLWGAELPEQATEPPRLGGLSFLIRPRSRRLGELRQRNLSLRPRQSGLGEYRLLPGFRVLTMVLSPSRRLQQTTFGIFFVKASFFARYALSLSVLFRIFRLTMLLFCNTLAFTHIL